MPAEALSNKGRKKINLLVALHRAAKCPAFKCDLCALFTVLTEGRALFVVCRWALAIFDVTAGKLAGFRARCARRCPLKRERERSRERFRNRFRCRFGQWVGDSEQGKSKKGKMKLHVGSGECERF